MKKRKTSKKEASSASRSSTSISDRAEEPGYFSVYLSSAGSGKTFTLTRSYLKWALSAPSALRRFAHIVEITFTNKATEDRSSVLLSY